MFLLNGRPSCSGEYKIRLGMGGISKQKSDSIEFDHEEIMEILISNQQTVLELKQKLAETVSSKLNIPLDPKKLRLREKVNLKLSKVFHNDDLLKSHRIYDR